MDSELLVKVMSIVEEVLIEFNNDIVNSLNKKGSKAISVNSKINNIIKVIPDDPKLVGVPHDLDAKKIKEIISKKQIPVVAL